MAHAFLSPSGASAWLRCHAKVWREDTLPKDGKSSSFADEGTAAHFLLEHCLTSEGHPSAFKDKWITVTPDGAKWMESKDDAAMPCFQIDDEMVRAISQTVDVAHNFNGVIYPEQKLSVEFITGEKDATGTSDIVVVESKTLTIADLKYGKGAQVFAEDNEQLLIYGAAALAEFDVLGEIENLRMVISQPRLNHCDEWELPVAEVNRRIEQIRKVADEISAYSQDQSIVLEATPGEKQCRFCAFKGQCPEYRDFVLCTVADDFVDLNKGELALGLEDAERAIAQVYGVKAKDVVFERAQSQYGDSRFVISKPSIKPQLSAAEERITNSDDAHLATCMDALDMVESWAKAVRAEVERRLLKGEFTDKRYKLVEGKKGARSWAQPDDAEKAMKSMRLKVDEMYDLKLISPTSAEKLLAADHPRKWNRLQDQIMQSQGKPSVAPASDKRPALDVAVKFEAIPEETEAQSLEHAEGLI